MLLWRYVFEKPIEIYARNSDGELEQISTNELLSPLFQTREEKSHQMLIDCIGVYPTSTEEIGTDAYDNWQYDPEL